VNSIYIEFFGSLGLLVISANLLLKFVERLSSKIRVSPLIIGSTLIAIGTSLPETSVALSAIAQNVPEISFGNIIGSNIANVCLILGLGILVFPVRIGTQKTQKNNIILLVLTFFFIALLFVPQAQRSMYGIGLIVFYLVFLVVELFWGKMGSLKEDRKTLAKMKKPKGSVFIYLIGIIGSLFGLILSSKYLVSSAVLISKILKVSDETIGLTVIALGTTLPELATTIISGINKDWKLLYGNIQGSTVYNLSVIGFLLIVFGNNTQAINPFALTIMAGTTVAIIILSHKYEGTHIPRAYGLMFLAIYALYILKLYKT